MGEEGQQRSKPQIQLCHPLPNPPSSPSAAGERVKEPRSAPLPQGEDLSVVHLTAKLFSHELKAAISALTHTSAFPQLGICLKSSEETSDIFFKAQICLKTKAREKNLNYCKLSQYVFLLPQNLSYKPISIKIEPNSLLPANSSLFSSLVRSWKKKSWQKKGEKKPAFKF